jgi:hypothetical protein
MVQQPFIAMLPEEKMAVPRKTAAVPHTGMPPDVIRAVHPQPVTERFIVTASTEHKAKSNYLI